MQPISRTSILSENKAEIAIAKVWRGYQVRKHFLPSNMYSLSKFYLKNHPNLEHLPKASSGSAPVYFAENLSVVFKECGIIKSKSRFKTMIKIRMLCEKSGYKNLIIPRASPYQKFIIEERLPLSKLREKEQVGLYYENREKFSSVVKEFVKLLSQLEYHDILTSSHPYQQESDIPLGRYDNIPLFVRSGVGKIGLIDLEQAKIRERSLLKEEVFEDIALKALLLFPYHMSEIILTLKDLFPEFDFCSLQNEHVKILNRFNTIYSDHLDFALARISHKISRQVEQDVALDCSKNAREHCQIDKARVFGSQDSETDCSNWPRVCEKYGIEKINLKLPLISEEREIYIQEVLSQKIKSIERYAGKEELGYLLIKKMIVLIERSLKDSVEKTNHVESIDLLSARSISLPIKDLLSDLPLDSFCEFIINAFLNELKKEKEICYANVYRNWSGKQFIRIHC